MGGHGVLRKYILTFCVVVVTGLASGCAAATTAFTFLRSDQGFCEQMVELFNQDYPHITAELEPLRSKFINQNSSPI